MNLIYKMVCRKLPCHWPVFPWAFSVIRFSSKLLIKNDINRLLETVYSCRRLSKSIKLVIQRKIGGRYSIGLLKWDFLERTLELLRTSTYFEECWRISYFRGNLFFWNGLHWENLSKIPRFPLIFKT